LRDALGDRHGAAGLGSNARGDQLGAHTARGITRRRIAAHRLDLGGQCFNDGDMARGRIATRIGGV